MKGFRPAALRLVLLRPFIPLLLRTFPLTFLTFLADNLPLAPLKELRRITIVMDEMSRRIFSGKKEVLAGIIAVGDEEGNVKGDLGARMQGKDIMSTMRKSSRVLLRYTRCVVNLSWIQYARTCPQTNRINSRTGSFLAR